MGEVPPTTTSGVEPERWKGPSGLFIFLIVAIIAVFFTFFFFPMSPPLRRSHNAHLRPPGARLDSRQAIRYAQEAAEREGRRLSEYKAPEAHFEFVRKDKSWTVFFEGKVSMPGNHFTVNVDDPTGKTEVWPGE